MARRHCPLVLWRADCLAESLSEVYVGAGLGVRLHDPRNWVSDVCHRFPWRFFILKANPKDTKLPAILDAVQAMTSDAPNAKPEFLLRNELEQLLVF